MERKFLEDLGLEKEVVDKIIAEHGKSIQAEQSKTEDKEKELDLVNGKLKDANKAIKSYKDMDIDKIKESAEKWEQDYKTSQKELEKFKNETTLNNALRDYDSIDVELLEKAIDKDALKFTDDGITGLKEQIDKIKEDKPYLFKEVEEPGTDPEDDRFNAHEPPNNTGGDVSPMEAQIASIFNE